MLSRVCTRNVGRWTWGALLCAALLAGPALAQKIIGTVEGYHHLENPVWKEAKDPAKKGYSFRELIPTVPAKYRKLFPHIPKELALAALAAEAQKAQPPTLIRVGGGRTTPVTIVVPPGTKLVFKNTDPFTHRLYAVGVDSFAPNDTTKGETREWTVPKEGVFEIRDELAPSLRMWVVGEPKVAALSYPTMKGEFRLSVKEPGDYTVQAYFAGRKVGPAVEAPVDSGDVKLKPIVVAKPPKDDEEKK